MAIPVNNIEGRWFQAIDSDRGEMPRRVLCNLCPRGCRLNPGDRGFCFVRENVDGGMRLTTYGKSTGFCIDPIEKKPLNHFYPGTPVLSFGTAGCNLGCKFCQNWDISKSRQVARLSETASPEQIASAALRTDCTSVAFTYNDPVIWAEYAIDTARACHDVGVKTVAVTAGYITPEARAEFFQHMDAVNIDLKAFSEDFYFSLTASHLRPVLDTLVFLRRETDVWMEITNLIIPSENDSADELTRMCDWITENLGPDVPLHFSAFHPDFRMRDHEKTPPATLRAAHHIARRAGINFVYVGNVHDPIRQNTYCPKCDQLLIARDWYRIDQYNLAENTCPSCRNTIAGRFATAAGTWGRRRQPIQIEQF
jgi:AmmeMemoRadiSam system radical SAM enzyme